MNDFYQSAKEQLLAGCVRVLYFAPESVFNVGSGSLSGLGKILSDQAYDGTLVGMFVDEAHEFVIEKGVASRSAFSRFLELKGDESFENIPWIAMSATLDPDQCKRVIDALKIGDNGRLLRSKHLFHRLPNLCIEDEGSSSVSKGIDYVVELLRERRLSMLPGEDARALVIVQLTTEVKQFQAAWAEAGLSSVCPAFFYHGKLDGKDQESTLQAWNDASNGVLVGTSAISAGVNLGRLNEMYITYTPYTMA